MSDSVFPAAPPQMPQRPPSRGAALSRFVYARCGWRFEGQLPDVPKLVAIVAPHSSAWDVVWGLLAKIGLQLEVCFIGKRETFFWPLGPLLRGFGGIPIDRAHAQNVVGEISQLFAAHERLWFALAPEGTRRQVKEWKSGFWRIARAANVPILPVYFHYPRKVIGFGSLIHPSDDLASDMACIREFYRPWLGKNRGTI